jgi:hypothetical protein
VLNGFSACTIVNGRFWSPASVAAQVRASVEDVDPSTPTTMLPVEVELVVFMSEVFS